MMQNANGDIRLLKVCDIWLKLQYIEIFSRVVALFLFQLQLISSLTCSFLSNSLMYKIHPPRIMISPIVST